MSGAELRVALIGTGLIGQDAHLPAFAHESRAAVTWAVDSREDVLAEVCATWQIPNATNDWRQLLDRDDIDAVDICTPAILHAEIACAFAQRGVPVLVEKPAALSLADIDQMRAARKRANVPLMVAENWPFSSAYRRVSELLDMDGKWSPILLQTRHESALRLAPSDNNRRLGGDRGRLGYLFAAGIHTLNLARHLIGEIEMIGGFTTPCPVGQYGPQDDDCVLTAKFENDALGSLSFTGRSRHVGPRRLFFRLVAEEGVAEFDIWNGQVQVTRKGVATTFDHDTISRGYQEEVSHFVDCVLSGTTPMTSIDDQRRTLATVLAAYRGIQQQRYVSPTEVLGGVEVA